MRPWKSFKTSFLFPCNQNDSWRAGARQGRTDGRRQSAELLDRLDLALAHQPRVALDVFVEELSELGCRRRNRLAPHAGEALAHLGRLSALHGRVLEPR